MFQNQHKITKVLRTNRIYVFGNFNGGKKNPRKNVNFSLIDV